MDNIARDIGMTLMVLGGILILSILLCLLGWLLSFAWIAFSESFRAICKAESLIHEYRKNREKYLEWRKENVR